MNSFLNGVNRMNKLNEEVSIVIPVKNRERLVLRTLESVKEQKYRPVHLIVVDNHSSDSTWEVLERWATLNRREDFKITILDEPVCGAPAARNRGLKAVTSDKLLFFDSDDEMDPSLIENCMTAFGDDPGLELVYWRVGVSKHSGRIKKNRFSQKNLFRTHIYHGMLRTQAFMIRKELLNRTGVWNIELPCWNDWELGLRILLNKPKTRGIDKVLSIVHPQKESITGENFHSKAGLWEMSINACERDVDMISNADAKALKSMINYRRAILAAHYLKEGKKDLARNLLVEALSHSSLNYFSRIWLKILYHYTAKGGRGASLLWR